MKDRTWERYWRLIVLWLDSNRNHILWWNCRCDCGNERVVRWTRLWEGTVKSCGCLRREGHRKHMLSRDRFMWRRYAINSRCTDPWNQNRHNYGGRWIKCLWNAPIEFKNDMYDSYLEHVKEHWRRNTTIDRIDVNWHYCKDNCRWATIKEQWNNTRFNIFLEMNWKKQTIAQRADELWVNRRTAYDRYHRDGFIY